MVGRHTTRQALQLRCRQLGLQDHGTKAMLSSRLQSHASNPSSATGRGHPPPPNQDHAAQDDRTNIPSANRVHQPISLPPVQNQASIRGMQVDEEQKQEQVGRVDNLVTQASNFGKRTQIYDGVDASIRDQKAAISLQ